MQEYKEILKKEGIKGREMSGMLGLTYLSYRKLVGGSCGVPKWVKGFMIGYKLGKNSKDETKI